LQRIGQPLLGSKNPLTEERAFKMMREIEEASRQSQRRNSKLLRRLSVAKEGTETRSVRTPVEATGPAHASNAGSSGDFFLNCAWLEVPRGEIGGVD
jgi:hypothetical protein